MRYFLLFMMLILAGCRPRTPDVLPTLANVELAATAVILTENAPPSGFDVVSFPQIDANLTRLAGWRYEALIRFDGVVAGTDRPVSASNRVEVQYHQVANARRVVATIQSDLQDQATPITYEAVRLGEDVFLVRDGVCLTNAGTDAELAANLGAGALLGGVSQAPTAARRAIINGETVWQYQLDWPNITIPSLVVNPTSRILEARGELWVNPTANVVIRYHLNVLVENVGLFGASLPVTGELLLRYDVLEIGVIPNLNVPFGC